MNFGFSYIGLIFIAMLLIPNIIWTKHKPDGYDEYSKNENKVLLIFERIGEVLVMTLLLIFKDCNIRPHSLWIGWLILTFVLMAMYEMYWAGYFKSEKQMEDMYSCFAGFPVAGASLPVFAALSLGIYASNIFIIISVIILGIGHIGIHLAHRKEVMGKVEGKSKGKAKKQSEEKTKKSRRVVRVIKTILLVPVCLVVLLIIGIIAVRNYNFFACYIDTSKGIDASEYVEINGQEQFITIRGRDVSNPVILYLHGGPGSPDSSMTYTFTNELIDDYTVVCWDQRGCGRTYVRNKNIDKENETVTFEQALADVDTLTQYLKKRLNRDKVVIMGHSYGSVLGSTYAYEHPENVEAYIGIGQFVSFASSTEYEYEDALEKANAAGDDTTKLTEAYGKFLREKTVEAAGEMSTYAAPYHKATRKKSTSLAALVSPTLSSEDLLWYKNVTSYDTFIKYCGSLMDYLMTVNLRESQPHYEVPAYFISGECDWNCAAPDMVDYAQMVGAKYDLIDGCGHYVQSDAPEEFANLVKNFYH
ncbi:MAG: alpha/beta hydrolase [Eubacterium sp.]|nr:alpha/beta hydrolase [Eubacterium sp.]